MANDFAPTTTTFEPTSDDAATNAALNESAEGIDLNDPRFASEDIGVNPEGDAFAAPPPPPDAEYRAKLKLLDVEYKGNKMQYAPWASADGSKVAFFSKLEATIQDPSGKYDNLKVFDSWFSTLLNRDGSTKVSTLLTRLGKTVPARASHKLLMDELVKALASEPDIIISTQWEASCQACSEAFKNGGKQGVKPAGAKGVRGMSKFPLKPGSVTEHVPEIVCPTDSHHGVMVAQARIAGFKKLS
jgi:hypothetical protein